MERKCAECGKPFVPTFNRGGRKQIFCAETCRYRKYNRGRGTYSAHAGIARGTVGAINELRVAVDLLSKGFEVFRSLSQSCSCDLAVMKDGKLTRIEVRTGYHSRKVNKTSPHSKNVADSIYIGGTRIHRADVLAIALPDRIVYEPEFV